jgi:TrmH family RNA methyltransferase
VVAERISSVANPRVKAFAQLKESRERLRTGRFLIEGEREVTRAIEADVEIEILLICPELLADPLPEHSAHIEILELTTAAIGKVARRQNPPGVIAIARQFDTTLDSLALSDDPLVLIAEGVEKPGNLGAMLRTADAVGVDAVVVAGAGTDVFNPNVVRASQGALFSVPIAAASAADTIVWVDQHRLTVVAGYPEADRELWEVQMVGPLAILVGAEDTGIDSLWDGVAAPVRIPMAGAADSLNASVSAAVLLFEAARQRRRR